MINIRHREPHTGLHGESQDIYILIITDRQDVIDFKFLRICKTHQHHLVVVAFLWSEDLAGGLGLTSSNQQLDLKCLSEIVLAAVRTTRLWREHKSH